MYHEQQMRRFLSIALMMLFGLGPLAAAMPGSDEPQVAACCRRNGAHHCAMMEPGGSQTARSDHAWQSPSHCPLYPDSIKANLVSHHAMASQGAAVGSLPVQTHAAASSRAAARVSQMRTRAVRGPPIALQI